jgi:hypothetical protein
MRERARARVCVCTCVCVLSRLRSVVELPQPELSAWHRFLKVWDVVRLSGVLLE